MMYKKSEIKLATYTQQFNNKLQFMPIKTFSGRNKCAFANYTTLGLTSGHFYNTWLSVTKNTMLIVRKWRQMDRKL